KRASAFEGAAVDDFHRAKCAGHSPCQPNLTVSAATDYAQQFVIGNDWYLSRNLVGNGRFYTSSGGEAIPGSARALACWRWRPRHRELFEVQKPVVAHAHRVLRRGTETCTRGPCAPQTQN